MKHNSSSFKKYLKLSHKRDMARLILSAVFLLTFMGTCLTSVLNKKCPPADQLTYCTCESIAYDNSNVKEQTWIALVCQNVTKLQSFIEELKKFGDLEINSLELYNFNLKSLKRSIFSGLNIQILQIENSKFDTLIPSYESGTWFEGSLTDILYVIFVNTTIGQFDYSVFANLPALSHLELAVYCKVNTFSRWDVLGKMTNLSGFTLNDNKMTRINHGISKLTQLRYFDMSRNAITEFKRSSLPKPANNLIRIELSYNQIETLPYDIFDEMPRLRYFEIAFNKLTVISQDLFVPIAPKLRDLIVRGNPINCDYDALWILRIIYRKQKFVRHNDFKRIVCHSPDKVKGKRLRSLMESDLEIDNGIAK